MTPFDLLFRAILSACLCFFFLLIASAQTNPSETKLKTIFKAARAAVGDDRELKQIQDLEAFAECNGPRGKYTTLIKSFRSDKTYFFQTFEYKNQDSEVFINKGLGWKISATSPGFSIVSPFEKLVVNLHEYQKMAFAFEEMFTDFRLLGEENFEKRISMKISATNKIGGEIYLFFDKETKTLAGYVLPIPNSDESVKNVFREWKNVGGLNLPTIITATDTAGEWTLNFHRITLNKSDESMLNIPPRVEDLVELLRLHKQHQTAHLTYNAELFIDTFAENLPQIQSGEVIERTKTENLERIKNYFYTYKFLEWEDMKPPLIKISKDGTMATKIVEKRVSGSYKNEKGETVDDKTEFAWLEVWEKIDGKWKVATVASTRKPSK